MSTQPSNNNLDFQRFIVQVLGLIVGVISLGLGFYTVSQSSRKSDTQDSKPTPFPSISTKPTTSANNQINAPLPKVDSNSPQTNDSNPPENSPSKQDHIADVKCGSPLGSGNQWWPVNGPASALARIRTAYCQDAFVRDDGSLQIASFTSYEEARRFAEKLSNNEPYQFRVGEPTYAGSVPAPSPVLEPDNRRTITTRKYPLAECGSPRGSGSYWWAVKGSYKALSMIKSQYCADALEVGGETQVASFSNYDEAKSFSHKLSQETGMSFWVKSQ